MKIKRLALGLAAAAMIAAPLAAPAQAADGDTPLAQSFVGAGPTTLLSDLGLATDFSHTTLLTQASHPGGDGSMWDPGTYVIGDNPHDFHPFWVDFGDTGDNMLIVNGFQNLNQKVLEGTVPGVVCTTPGSNVTYSFGANMVNILPLSAASDGGAAITVLINGTPLGSEVVLSNDPSNVIEITGTVPAAASLTVTIVNNGTAYSGNDFAIDDLTLTQRGECVPPCVDEVKGVWHNYTGNFAKNGLDANNDGIPDLNDPNWHTPSGTPGGQHDVTVRGFDAPYQVGKPKGNGDWFYWSDEGTKCPTA